MKDPGTESLEFIFFFESELAIPLALESTIRKNHTYLFFSGGISCFDTDDASSSRFLFIPSVAEDIFSNNRVGFQPKFARTTNSLHAFRVFPFHKREFQVTFLRVIPAALIIQSERGIPKGVIIFVSSS